MTGAGAGAGAGAEAGVGGTGERGMGGATERGVEEVGPGVPHFKKNKKDFSERKILIVGANEREVRGFIKALFRLKALLKLH